MASIESFDLLVRIEALERTVRRTRSAWLITTICATALLTGAWMSVSQDPEILRARQLVLIDDQGRERMILGAPLPSLLEQGRELPQRIGMVIHDSLGFERFGLSLNHRGSIGMGFDAPPGTGDDRNRERINIWADENGGATIRFLDRRTRVPARMYLDEDNEVWFEFLRFEEDAIIRKRTGFHGEEIIRDRR